MICLIKAAVQRVSSCRVIKLCPCQSLLLFSRVKWNANVHMRAAAWLAFLLTWGALSKQFAQHVSFCSKHRFKHSRWHCLKSLYWRKMKKRTGSVHAHKPNPLSPRSTGVVTRRGKTKSGASLWVCLKMIFDAQIDYPSFDLTPICLDCLPEWTSHLCGHSSVSPSCQDCQEAHRSVSLSESAPF